MAAKVTYKIDMVEVFNRAYSDLDMEVRSQLRPLLSDPTVKEVYGREVISKIVKNTRANRDKDGDPMGKYSKAYIKSTIFKIYKAGQTKVNLTLTGEMLASMQAIYRPSGRNITIDFVDQLNNDKAHGQIYKNKYNFLGLPKDEEEQILRKIINDASEQGLLGNLDISISAQIGRQNVDIGGGDNES